MNQYFNDNSKSVAVHVKMDAASVIELSKSSSGNHHGGKLFRWYVCKRKDSYWSASSVSPCHLMQLLSTDGKAVCLRSQWSSKKGEYSFSRHEVTTGASDGKFTEVKLCNHLKGKNGAPKKIVTDERVIIWLRLQANMVNMRIKL